MTRNFENTIISLLRGMDRRMDGMASDISEVKTGYGHLDKKVDLVIDILAEHSSKLKEHDKMLQEIIAGVIPEMEKSTKHGLKLKNHERRIASLESV